MQCNNKEFDILLQLAANFNILYPVGTFFERKMFNIWSNKMSNYI